MVTVQPALLPGYWLDPPGYGQQLAAPLPSKRQAEPAEHPQETDCHGRDYAQPSWDGRFGSQRHPDLGGIPGNEEVLGHDADHGPRLAVQGHDSAQHARIRSETVPPCGMADHQRPIRCAGPILFRAEEPPQGRFHPQEREEIGRDACALDLLGVARAGQRQVGCRRSGILWTRLLASSPRIRH